MPDPSPNHEGIDLERTPESPRRIKGQIAVTMVGYILAALVGNVVVTRLLSGQNLWLDFEWVLCFFGGVLLAQACLLAIWCGLGNQSLWIRAFASIGILLGGTLAYMMGLNMDSTYPPPAEVWIVIFVIAACLFLSLLFPVSFIRWKQKRILTSIATDVEALPSQFGIKHLILATTAVAIFIAVLQQYSSNMEFTGDAPWHEIIPFCLIFLTLATFNSLLCFIVVFSNRLRIGALVILGITLAGGPVAASYFLSLLFKTPFPNNAEHFINGFSFAVGTTITMLLVLSHFRFLGFRLRKT